MAEEWNVHLCVRVCVLGLGLAGVAFWLPFRTTQKTLKRRHTHFYLASADLRHHRLQDGWGLQAFVFAIDGAHLLSDFSGNHTREASRFCLSLFQALMRPESKTADRAIDRKALFFYSTVRPRCLFCTCC